MPETKAPAWVEPLMRLGYAARGATYVLLGGLVLSAALTGGRAEDTRSALATLRGQPFGAALLWALAAGFLAYAAWRIICAAMDLEQRGAGGKGIVARLGQTVSGLVQAGLAVTAARLALGAGGDGGGGTTTLASWLLQFPLGRWLMLAVGLGAMAAGLYYGVKAFGEKYKDHIRYTPLSARLDPAVKTGLLAHGLVILMIGGFLAWAGWTSDASDAGGMTRAFEAVRAQPFGQSLLAVLALGLLGFAVYCFVEAAYRVLPSHAGTDVTTIAARARAKARQQAARAGARSG